MFIGKVFIHKMLTGVRKDFTNVFLKKSFHFLKLRKCCVEKAILQREIKKLLSKNNFFLNLRLGHVLKMSLIFGPISA